MVVTEEYDMKVKIEWHEGAAWKQSSVEVKSTRNNNLMCEHDGQVLVLPNLHEGSEVVGLAGGKWSRCGRVTRGAIFLGEGLSYSETNEQLFQGKRPEEIMVKF